MNHKTICHIVYPGVAVITTSYTYMCTGVFPLTFTFRNCINIYTWYTEDLQSLPPPPPTYYVHTYTQTCKADSLLRAGFLSTIAAIRAIFKDHCLQYLTNTTAAAAGLTAISGRTLRRFIRKSSFGVGHGEEKGPGRREHHSSYSHSLKSP